MGVNPGDDFIRCGIEYLMKQVIPGYKAYYINKHEFRRASSRWWHLCKKAGSIHRNIEGCSIDSDGNGDLLAASDIVIQAGTPFYYKLPSGKSSATTRWIQNTWGDCILRRKHKAGILILGVGTCQPFYSDGLEFYEDKKLVRFMKVTNRLAELTVVRDPLGKRVFDKLNLQAYLLPCPAIFAGDHYGIRPEGTKIVAMNYMPYGGHYKLGQQIDGRRWESTFVEIYKQLVKRYKVVILCHSEDEIRDLRNIIPDADVFFSTNYRDYLDIYSRVQFGIFNRVHSAIALSGFGRPSVIVGADTRARMGELLGIPVCFVDKATPDALLGYISSFETESTEWNTKLRQIKESAQQEYLKLLSSSVGRLLERVKL